MGSPFLYFTCLSSFPRVAQANHTPLSNHACLYLLADIHEDFPKSLLVQPGTLCT